MNKHIEIDVTLSPPHQVTLSTHMKTLIAIISLCTFMAACVLLAATGIYAAGGLAAARTTEMIPLVGASVSQQIEGWVLGDEAEHTIYDAPLYPIGTPIAAPTQLPVTPIPGNPDCGQPYTLPAEGPITSGFGWRPSPYDPSKSEFHAGIDISVPSGTSVVSTICGKVTQAGWSDLYGNVVAVSNGNVTTLYGHNSQLLVAEGQEVAQGQIVALSGSTGRSTGPHVHYGVSINGSWVDPLAGPG